MRYILTVLKMRKHDRRGDRRLAFHLSPSCSSSKGAPTPFVSLGTIVSKHFDLSVVGRERTTQ